MTHQLNFIYNDSDWVCPSEYPDLSQAKEWGIDPKADLWKLPAGYVGFYAEQDAALTLKLWQHFKNEITKQSLNDVWEMEMELLPILSNT